MTSPASNPTSSEPDGTRRAADPTMCRLVDLAEAILDTAGEATRLRLVFEFLRGAGEDGLSLQSLVAAEPVLTGAEHFDALLAAIAEDLCVHAGVRPPDWVHDDSRFLDWVWWVSDLSSARAEALVHTPASYRRRGVMIARRDLQATVGDRHPRG